jgi:hypothetical protein
MRNGLFTVPKNHQSSLSWPFGASSPLCNRWAAPAGLDCASHAWPFRAGASPLPDTARSSVRVRIRIRAVSPRHAGRASVCQRRHTDPIVVGDRAVPLLPAPRQALSPRGARWPTALLEWEQQMKKKNETARKERARKKSGKKRRRSSSPSSSVVILQRQCWLLLQLGFRLLSSSSCRSSRSSSSSSVANPNQIVGSAPRDENASDDVIASCSRAGEQFTRRRAS